MTCEPSPSSPDAVPSTSDLNAPESAPSPSPRPILPAELFSPDTGPTSPASPTSETLLPTPTVGDSKGTKNATAGRSNPDSQHHAGMTLTDAIVLLPTPQAADALGGRIGKNEVTLRTGRRPSGQKASKPLATAIYEASISSPADSPASPSPTPERVQPRPTSGGFGPRCSEPCAFFDPATSSWRMCQGSLLEDSGSSLATWPKQGTWDAGFAYELLTSGHPIDGSESSWLLLPTPMARDHKGAHSPNFERQGGANLPEAVLLPTPTASDGTGGGRDAVRKKRRWPNAEDSLRDAVKLLPTPSASGDARNTHPTSDHFSLAGELLKLRGVSTPLPSPDGSTSSDEPPLPRPTTEDD